MITTLPRNSTIPILLLLLLFFSAGLVLFASVSIEADYGAISLTNHAKKAHTGQAWTAERIQTFFSENRCKPNINLCEDIEIHWCELRPGYSIGLIIGRQVQKIITGFAARTSFWASPNRCEN